MQYDPKSELYQTPHLPPCQICHAYVRLLHKETSGPTSQASLTNPILEAAARALRALLMSLFYMSSRVQLTTEDEFLFQESSLIGTDIHD